MGMKKTSIEKRIFCGLAACLLLVGSVTSCKDGEGGTSSKKDTTQVEQRVMDFVAKCNELDLDGILRCLNPEVAEPIAWMFELLKVGHISKEEVLETVYSVMTAETAPGGLDFFESIEVEIEDVRMGKKQATVIADVSYVVADIPFDKDGEFYLIKEADTWYISGLGLEE